MPVHTTEPRGLDDHWHWHRHYLYDSSSTSVLLLVYVHTVHIITRYYQSILDTISYDVDKRDSGTPSHLSDTMISYDSVHMGKPSEKKHTNRDSNGSVMPSASGGGLRVLMAAVYRGVPPS